MYIYCVCIYTPIHSPRAPGNIVVRMTHTYVQSIVYGLLLGDGWLQTQNSGKTYRFRPKTDPILSSNSRETPSRDGISFHLPVFTISKGLSHIPLALATSRVSYCIEFTHPRRKSPKRTPPPERKGKGKNLRKL